MKCPQILKANHNDVNDHVPRHWGKTEPKPRLVLPQVARVTRIDINAGTFKNAAKYPGHSLSLRVYIFIFDFA